MAAEAEQLSSTSTATESNDVTSAEADDRITPNMLTQKVD
jgi:hypothetical protein